ncbi:melatonin receptor type 1A-like [Lingula anatina]|uniref:Melatonin receptor type 1A-like n=1 Tax=Lingula anatina TaxID=7574 RepID=A0A1S3JXR6_LINAN|nr:melatonin receptor type 1A-like [Lingula anatina]|eukprot:XP_013414846.2 melatonin receptor type 1A-like [Lingula anatina]
MPSAILTFAFGETVFSKPGCIFLAFLESVACGVSLMSLMLIAINRYLFICEYHRYAKICTGRLITAAVVASWVTVAVLIAFPPLVGWGNYGYDAKTEDCIVDRTADLIYNIYGTGVFIMVPLLFTFFCYFKIFQTVYTQRKAMRNHVGFSGRQISKKDIKLIVTLLVVLLMFVLCWVPFVGAVLFDGVRDMAPSDVYLSAAWLAMTNSCINSFIYGVADPNFRQGYKKILLCCQTKSSRVGTTDTTPPAPTA